jgi:hypothetical protein
LVLLFASDCCCCCCRRWLTTLRSLPAGTLCSTQEEVQCFHDSAGPPLHTILFDIEADENKHGVYAQHTLDGVEHVLTEFEGLNLHDTVAIVVPDGKFRAAFATQLQAALDAAYPGRFELVTSRKASAAIAATGAMGGGGGGSDAAPGGGLGVAGGDDSKEWLVLDTMDAMAGLERAFLML